MLATCHGAVTHTTKSAGDGSARLRLQRFVNGFFARQGAKTDPESEAARLYLMRRGSRLSLEDFDTTLDEKDS